jgi:hypothetical protein
MLSQKTINIYESKKITDILKYEENETCVVVDLDNTVMETVVELGSDQWFCKMYSFLMSVSPSPETEILTIALYCEIQKRTAMQLVENNVKEVIQHFQKKDKPLFALTARGVDLAERTIEQLKNLNIELAFNQAPADYHLFKVAAKNVIYYKGVVFCDGLSKGQVLDAFLKECKYQTPKHILMVDDKLKHLLNVRDTIKEQHNFTGLHYSYLEKKAETIDMDKAGEQLIAMLPSLPKVQQEFVKKYGLTSFHKRPATSYTPLLYKSAETLPPKDHTETKAPNFSVWR